MLFIGDKIAGKQLDRIFCKTDHRDRVDAGIDNSLDQPLFLYIMPDKPDNQNGSAERDHFRDPLGNLPAARVHQFSS